MEPITVFAALTTAVSTVKMIFIEFIKVWWLNDKIKNKEKRSATVDFIALILGMTLGVVINLLGGFGLSILTAIMVGGGMSYAGSNLTNRVVHTYKKGKA